MIFNFSHYFILLNLFHLFHSLFHFFKFIIYDFDYIIKYNDLYYWEIFTYEEWNKQIEKGRMIEKGWIIFLKMNITTKYNKSLLNINIYNMYKNLNICNTILYNICNIKQKFYYIYLFII